MARPASTPVGAGALAAALVTIGMYLLSLWPAWAHVPGEVKNSVQVILTFAAAYLAGWASVVRSPGQQVHLELTSSRMPTVQSVPEHPDAVPVSH